MSAQDILDAYNTLWRIEDCFRVMKSTLETRPIFRWTPKRIEGHFMVSFLAFQMERALEIKLRHNKSSMSPQQIRKALRSLCFAECSFDNNSKIYLKLKPEAGAASILRVMRMRSPKNIMTPGELTSLQTDWA